MTFSYFFGKFKNGPFWPNFGHLLHKYQLYIACGFFIKSIFLTNYVLIFPNFVFQVISRYSWTVSSCRGKVHSLPFSGFLGVPGTINFSCLNLNFDHFSYLSLSISHFNLSYLDLCKFKLFDEPLQSGLVIQLYIYIVI